MILIDSMQSGRSKEFRPSALYGSDYRFSVMMTRR